MARNARDKLSDTPSHDAPVKLAFFGFYFFFLDFAEIKKSSVS